MSVLCNGEEYIVDETASKEHVGNSISMAQRGLCRSFQQNKKYFSVKDKVEAWIHSQPEKEKELFYGPAGKNLFAVILNDKYAFKHIFKNGGTTVNQSAKRGHVKPDEVGNRSLVAVVRDPIDHFMSGWAECGSRATDLKESKWFDPDINVNKRALFWLWNLESCLSTKLRSRGPECVCISHSFPQATFLLDPETKGTSILPNIEMVGHLSELHGMLLLAGLDYDPSEVKSVRIASTNPSKVSNFSWNKNMLSDGTLMLICEFVILDYYLFDFEPPARCRDTVESHSAMIAQMLV
mmetsp:Transcript_23301/g.29381  ORF Transcript_23301/g.29381 Transcript_23301/m.29381 type:complete len:295 (+) Transcript_23301:84-968(+)